MLYQAKNDEVGTTTFFAESGEVWVPPKVDNLSEIWTPPNNKSVSYAKIEFSDGMTVLTQHNGRQPHGLAIFIEHGKLCEAVYRNTDDEIDPSKTAKADMILGILKNSYPTNDLVFLNVKNQLLKYE